MKMDKPQRVILTAEIIVLPGNLEAVLKSAGCCAVATRKEPGCEQYLLTTARDRSGVVQFMEIFRSQEAFEVHANAPHTREFVQSLSGLVEGDKPRLTFFVEVDVTANN
jgi:quinol monooxygenase YgiN